MLSSQMQIALKEWAVVQRSLLEQHQIMLLRKGGIVEETGDFQLQAEEFLLLPTYEHETERQGDLQPCFNDWLNEEEQRKPQASEIRVDCACRVEDVVRVSSPDPILRLAPQHIWSTQFITSRFDWEPYKPVFVILVRAYQLAEPVVIPREREYGGCRSWVTLRDPISTAGAVSAIRNDETFKRRLTLTRRALNDTGMGISPGDE